jgi:membrane protease YdiL (CAAX protease family)
LAIFLALEFLFRPLLRNAAKHWHIAAAWSPLLQMALLVAAAWLLLSSFARVPLRELGLRPWRKWARTEKLYFVQILPLTVAIFFMVQFPTLKHLFAAHAAHLLGIVFLQQMLWGLYQELLYRGIVQTELVHRFGAIWGILVANLVFTFGPLHFYHFALSRHDHAHLWIFVGIFAIGLYFAVLYHRSRNLWIIAALHGCGDFFIDGLAQIIRFLR